VSFKRSVAGAGVLLLPFAGHATAQRVEFDRPAYRLHSIGQRLPTSVRVLDASGRRIANAQTVFHVADSTVVTVTPRGEVVSRKSGYTRIWAIAGRDSGSAFVTVDPRAARFAFSPSILRIDALRGTVPLIVQVSDSAGVPIAGAGSATSSCRSLNERIATINGRGDVVARANGATYIRCADRGFADSVRVEVRQRAIRATLGTRSIAKAVGDTFSVRLRATDRLGDTLVGARPTWVSMDPKTVTVDPSSGRALAKGEGSTRLIAQLGDVADTAIVSVGAPRGGALLQAPIAVVDTTTPVTSTAKRMTIRVVSLSMYEGQIKPLIYTVSDTLGIPMTDVRATIRSTDTTVAAPTDSGMKAGKIGEVWAIVRYQNLIDSAVVTVKDSTKRGEEENAGSDAESSRPIVEPTYAPDLAEKYAKERADAMDAIHRSGEFSAPTGKNWSASVYAGLAAHSTNQVNSATSQLIEDRTGVIYGGRTLIKPVNWMALTGDLRLGQLNTDGIIGEQLTITEAKGDMTFYLMPWLGLGGGFAVRSEKTKIALQQWTIPHASITGRTDFVGDFISTFATLSVLPGATFSGIKDQRPDMGTAGEAGLEIRRGSLDAGLAYYVEKLPFPDQRGRSRVDQFSSLRLRVGFKVGR
jgi:hypothetical protein